jgi:hypothetical protein
MLSELERNTAGSGHGPPYITRGEPFSIAPTMIRVGPVSEESDLLELDFSAWVGDSRPVWFRVSDLIPAQPE